MVAPVPKAAPKSQRDRAGARDTLIGVVGVSLRGLGNPKEGEQDSYTGIVNEKIKANVDESQYDSFKMNYAIQTERPEIWSEEIELSVSYHGSFI